MNCGRELTNEIAEKILAYDKLSGRLFWLKRSSELFCSESHARTWNKKHSGKEAFCGKDNYGYRRGTIFNKEYRAHRVIWLLEKGRWPDGEIDHIDGDVANNRIENLRDVSHSTNLRNSTLNCKNSTGISGVCWNRNRGKWLAQIRVDGRNIYLGLYDTMDEAVIARKAAEKASGFHHNHGRST